MTGWTKLSAITMKNSSTTTAFLQASFRLNGYSLKSDRESGNGRYYNALMKSRREPAIAIEVKETLN